MKTRSDSAAILLAVWCMGAALSPLQAQDGPSSASPEKPVLDSASGKGIVVEPVTGGTVAGRVFDDKNGDGKKTADESYLGQVIVRLKNSDDEVISSIATDSKGIYIFKEVAVGVYQLEFDFGENQQVVSRPFHVNADRPSIIVEPVPYFRGFDFTLNRPIEVYRVYTPSELARPGDGNPPTTQPPTSPFRP